MNGRKPITLGILFHGEDKFVYTDGIGRYTYSIVKALLEHTDVKIELCGNRKTNRGIKEFYSKEITKFPNRISCNYYSLFTMFVLYIERCYSLLVGEITAWKSIPNEFKIELEQYTNYSKSWKKILHSLVYFSAMCSRTIHKFFLSKFFASSTSTPELAKYINRYSKADLFLCTHVNLCAIKHISCKKIIVCHDFFTIDFEDMFVKEQPSVKIFNKNIIDLCKNYIESDSYYLCHSNNIKNKLAHILPLDKISAVYLPVIKPNISPIENPALLSQFGISGHYIFYATHIRPYKNIEVILRALYLLKQKGVRILLVTTGKLEHHTSLVQLSEELNLQNDVICTGILNEDALYSLYKTASMSVVSTRAEGGFPWQAMEASYCNLPVVMSDIEVVKERLRFANVPEGSWSSLQFFPLDDHQALAHKIEFVMQNRESVIQEQQKLLEYINKYDWSDVAMTYHSLFEDIVYGRP